MRKIFILKSISIFLGSLFVLSAIHYATIYVTNKNSKTNQTNILQNINDKNLISESFLSAIENNIYYYNLDSNNNFNPQKELAKIDALNIIENLANKYYDTSKIKLNLPYFKNFNSTEYDANTIIKVTSLIDNKENYLKHYQILGYNLNKSEGITKKEFLLIMGSMLNENLGKNSDEIINNMMNLGFNTSSISSILSREESAILVESFIKIKSKRW